LATILRNNRDMIGVDIPVENVKKPEENIGKMNVDVEALGVLRDIQRELKARMQEHDSWNVQQEAVYWHVPMRLWCIV